jgi:hypothetical protein
MDAGIFEGDAQHCQDFFGATGSRFASRKAQVEAQPSILVRIQDG